MLEEGIYRHYKGGLYRLVCQARLEETTAPVVVYQALYDTEDFGNHPIWVRPLESFLEKVVVEGKELPRFAYVGPEA